MALNKTGLKNKIASLLNALKAEEDQESAIEQFATDLSDAIDDYVSNAQVTGTDSNGGAITGGLI